MFSLLRATPTTLLHYKDMWQNDESVGRVEQARVQEFYLWYADMMIAEELDGESYGRNKINKMNKKVYVSVMSP